MSPTTMTVLGEVEVDQLGPTLMHEHLFTDVTMFWEADQAGIDGADRPMTPDLGGIARWNANVVRDNLRIHPEHDFRFVADEITQLVATAGPGTCLVDLSTVPIGPHPEAVRRLSSETGAHVVLGTGIYVDAGHPDWVRDSDVGRLQEHLERELLVGVAGTDVRAGVIGEIGTSAIVTESELRMLSAAARAATATGVAVNIHCEPPELSVVHGILDALEAEGLDPSRTYLSHLDEIADPAYLSSVLRRGVVVGFDSFGQENYFSATWRARSDLEKGAMLMHLIEEGFVDQLVLAQDVCKKSHLKAFGGMGFDHVTTRVVPRLMAHAGLTREQADAMLVHTPRRLLGRVTSA